MHIRRRVKHQFVPACWLAACILVETCGFAWLAADHSTVVDGTLESEPQGCKAEDHTDLSDLPRFPSPDLIIVPAGLPDKVTPSLVKIVTDRGFGTGFVVDSAGLVLTCHHVVEGAKSVYVEFFGGHRAEVVETVAQDVDSDMALLRINATEDLVPLALAADLPSRGEQVFAFRFDVWYVGEVVSQETVARLSPISSKKVPHTARTYAGASGGPLLNRSGKVVGMNCSVRAGRSFAVPVAALKQIIRPVDLGRRSPNTVGRFRVVFTLTRPDACLPRCVASAMPSSDHG